jgi:5-methylcytosine-specific restriction endonuclease McrA
VTRPKPPVIITCSVCGTQKSFRPSDAAQRSGSYCSRRCSIIDRPKRENKIEFSCAGCGRTTMKWPSQVAGRVYCSKQCFHSSNTSTFSWAEWRKNNLNERREKERAWAALNKDRKNRSNREWAGRNKDRIKAWSVARRGTIRDKKGFADAVAEILRRANGLCCYCQKPSDRLEIEHIVPIARGGTSDPENLTAACRTCNASKGSKLLNEWAIPVKS